MARDDIRDTDGWRRMLARRVIAIGADRKFLETLTAAQVKQLAAISAIGSPEERRHAMRFLLWLDEAGDARVTAAVRKQWLQAARDTAPLEYGKSELGRMAYYVLFKASPPDAERLAVQHDFDETGADHEPIVGDLVTQGSPAAIEVLRRLASRNDAIGKAAGKGLEQLGLASEQTIAALAASWRRDRSGETLSRLYFAYIVTLKEGDPFAPVLKRMGKPSKQTGNRYWYESEGSGTTVFLQGDEEHGVIAFKKS